MGSGAKTSEDVGNLTVCAPNSAAPADPPHPDPAGKRQRRRKLTVASQATALGRARALVRTKPARDCATVRWDPDGAEPLCPLVSVLASPRPTRPCFGGNRCLPGV
ncbi:uncharacterized protein LOC126958959 [Macaca thibetana thibetana]|uniref:uncharacterized protein LOC126958959 n=1 Tax=Macaca thibetana thibetana TaxID=257877 RepID=UPI0021BC5669|nr:uncharacterized protein LOC126958959 [Macaca thibetana thibetana]